jgi:hypothetical protein
MKRGKGKVRGWTLCKPGNTLYKHISVSKTRESLLISYDMIPLRGLDQCEKHLLSKGIKVTEVEIIVDHDHKHGFAPVVEGIPNIDMIDYGAFSDLKDVVFLNTALYLTDCPHIIREERATLYNYFFLDKRKVRKKAFEKLRAKVESILLDQKISIEGIRLETISLPP